MRIRIVVLISILSIWLILQSACVSSQPTQGPALTIVLTEPSPIPIIAPLGTLTPTVSATHNVLTATPTWPERSATSLASTLPLSQTTPLPPVAFELAYVVTLAENGLRYSQLRLYDSETGQDNVLYRTQPGSVILTDDVDWRPNHLDELCFTQIEPDRTWALWCYQRISAEAKQMTNPFPAGFGFMQDWSPNGDWLTLLSQEFPNAPEDAFYWLVNIETQRASTIDYAYRAFAWDPLVPGQFIHYWKDWTQLQIRDANAKRLIKTIKIDFSDFSMSNIRSGFSSNIGGLAWQASPQRLYAAVREESGHLYQYDFMERQWRYLDNFRQTGTCCSDFGLSPSGEWLVFADGGYQQEKVYLLDTTADEPELRQAFSGEIVIVVGWAAKPELLALWGQNRLWLIDPQFPENRRMILDLNSIGLADYYGFDVRFKE